MQEIVIYVGEPGRAPEPIGIVTTHPETACLEVVALLRAIADTWEQNHDTELTVPDVLS